MQEDDLLDHVNKIKAFIDQLACLKVFVCKKNIILTLLESILTSYEYLITTLSLVLMKELTMESCDNRFDPGDITVQGKKPQGKSMVMVLHKSKAGNSPSRQGV